MTITFMYIPTGSVFELYEVYKWYEDGVNKGYLEETFLKKRFIEVIPSTPIDWRTWKK